jgi:pantetheine-phosphate adenylyltransferase
LSAVVLYPGSFDPFHNGHRELVETASYLFDEVVVAAMVNPQKGKPLFDLEEREQLIKESVTHLDNVTVMHFNQLVVKVAQEVGADFIIKGLRAPSDFEAEMAQAQMNLAVSGVHTVFIPSASANSMLASKYIRDIVRFGGDVSAMVPAPVAKRLREKFGVGLKLKGDEGEGEGEDEDEDE